MKICYVHFNLVYCVCQTLTFIIEATITAYIFIIVFVYSAKKNNKIAGLPPTTSL